MSLKRRKQSIAFNWHRSFSILAPWRKGKGDMALESEVVLTKMKFFSNVHEKLLKADDSVSTVSMSVSEQDDHTPHAEEVISIHSTPPESNTTESKEVYLSAMFSNTELPILYKFESEDSGVEMASGANSPSTPTGSEHSFVVHSREHSCDSGNQDSHIAASSSLHLIGESTDTLDTEQLSCIYAKNNNLTRAEDRDEMDNVQLKVAGNSEWVETGTLGDASECCKIGSECAGALEVRIDDDDAEDTLSRSHVIEAYDDSMRVELQQQPLRKSTTSDSLDEYMEECCRLSEVTQTQTSPLGSGLGYLEHICQLIEKIGQLQEHNLKLQKQICGLQMDGKMMKTKEDFFLQHCYCGAASLAFQELNRHSRSDYSSLTASSCTLSDLTTIPEGTHVPLQSASRDCKGGCQPNLPLKSRGFSRRSYTEGEARYLSNSTEILFSPHRRLENYAWGRVKDLVRKSKMRNQSRLGLSSSSFKRSCPQLYRPELGPLELSRRDRNSMIVLGHQKLDYHWAQ